MNFIENNDVNEIEEARILSELMLGAELIDLDRVNPDSLFAGLLKEEESSRYEPEFVDCGENFALAMEFIGNDSEHRQNCPLSPTPSDYSILELNNREPHRSFMMLENRVVSQNQETSETRAELSDEELHQEIDQMYKEKFPDQAAYLAMLKNKQVAPLEMETEVSTESSDSEPSPELTDEELHREIDQTYKDKFPDQAEMMARFARQKFPDRAERMARFARHQLPEQDEVMARLARETFPDRAEMMARFASHQLPEQDVVMARFARRQAELTKKMNAPKSRAFNIEAKNSCQVDKATQTTGYTNNLPSTSQARNPHINPRYQLRQIRGRDKKNVTLLNGMKTSFFNHPILRKALNRKGIHIDVTLRNDCLEINVVLAGKFKRKIYVNEVPLVSSDHRTRYAEGSTIGFGGTTWNNETEAHERLTCFIFEKLN